MGSRASIRPYRVSRRLLPRRPGAGRPGAGVLSWFGPVLDGPQLLEEPQSVGDLPGVRGVDEGEPGDVAEPERGHLEDDRCQ